MSDSSPALLWRRGDVRTLLIAVGLWQIGHLPLGFGALLLAVDRNTDYAVAGGILGAASLLNAVFGLVEARLVVRYSPAAVVVPLGWFASALAGAAAGTATNVPPTVTLGLVAGGLALKPNLASLQRAMWERAFDRREDRMVGHVWMGVQTPVLHAVGPLVLAVSTALAGPAASVAAGALLTGSAFLVALTVPLFRASGAQPEAAGRVAWRALMGDHRGWPLLNLATLSEATALAAMGVAAAALSTQEGQPALTGLLLAASSIGGLASGVVLTREAATIRMLGLARWATAVGSLALAVAAVPILPLVTVALFCTGAAHTAFHISTGVLAAEWAPSRRSVEGVAQVATTHALGDAVGRAAGGVVADTGPAGCFVLAAFAMTGAGAALVGRRAPRASA